MSQAVDDLLNAAAQLTPGERDEFLDRLVAGAADKIPAVVEASHLAEVRRRIALEEAGQAPFVTAEEMLARARQKIEAALAAG